MWDLHVWSTTNEGMRVFEPYFVWNWGSWKSESKVVVVCVHCVSVEMGIVVRTHLLMSISLVNFYSHLSWICPCVRFGALKSDSIHHFFRNACTKSGSLRFSQFSGCWLILSVCILVSFDFPFVRLFGVR